MTSYIYLLKDCNIMTSYLLKDCNIMTSYLLKDSKVYETGSSQQTKLETHHGRQEQVQCERRTERTEQLERRREGGRERARKLVNTNTAKTPAHKAGHTRGNFVASTKVAANSKVSIYFWQLVAWPYCTNTLKVAHVQTPLTHQLVRSQIITL